MENTSLNTESWELMAKYLSGEMSDQECSTYMNHLESDERLKEEMAHASAAFSLTKHLPKSKPLDVDRAWNHLSDRIQKDDLPKKTIKLNVHLGLFLKLAAVLVVAVVLGGLYIRYYSDRNVTSFAVSTLGNEQKDVCLPDQSVVSLNSISTIAYINTPNQHVRAVKLEGEAFFKVKRDTSKPFIVSAGAAEVQVLGTSFNVNSRSKRGGIEVCVKTGKVRVSNKSGQSIDLVANEKAILVDGHLIKEPLENENYLAWKSKKLVFNNQPKLKEVVDLLNEVYHANLVVTGQVGEIAIGNTTFDNYSLDQILEVLCGPMDLRAERKDGNIILSRK